MSGAVQVRLAVSDELREPVGSHQFAERLVGRFAYTPEIRFNTGEPVFIDDLTIVTGKPIGLGFVEVTAARVDEFDQRYVWVTLTPWPA